MRIVLNLEYDENGTMDNPIGVWERHQRDVPNITKVKRSFMWTMWNAFMLHDKSTEWFLRSNSNTEEPTCSGGWMTKEVASVEQKTQKRNREPLPAQSLHWARETRINKCANDFKCMAHGPCGMQSPAVSVWFSLMLWHRSWSTVTTFRSTALLRPTTADEPPSWFVQKSHGPLLFLSSVPVTRATFPNWFDDKTQCHDTVQEHCCHESSNVKEGKSNKN